MEWSDFTKENIKQFKKNKYKLDNKSNLVKLIKQERSRICEFIKNNPKIDIKNSKQKQDKKFIQFAKTPWVDTNQVIKQINKLENTFGYQWASIINNNNVQTKNNIWIKSNDIDLQTINKKIRLIIYMIEYLKHTSQNVNKSVNIYLVLTDLKKCFPENNKPMGVKNANTGYTDFNENIIFIWRKEEVEKVIFHEISHYLDMDKRDHHVDHIANIVGPHSYYEAFTDVWGILYHLIFVSILSKLSVSYLLEIELGFIKNQAMYLNDYLKLGNWVNSSNQIIKQLTPAFSYYIIKFMIFEHLITHDLVNYSNYNDLIKNISKVGFKQEPYIKLKSSRMTMIQLN